MFARAIANDAIAGGARPRGVSSLFSWRGEKGGQIIPKKVAKKNAGASLANTVAFRKILETGTWKLFLGHLTLAIGLRDDERPIVADLMTLPHLLVAGESNACRAACRGLEGGPETESEDDEVVSGFRRLRYYDGAKRN